MELDFLIVSHFERAADHILKIYNDTLANINKEAIQKRVDDVTSYKKNTYDVLIKSNGQALPNVDLATIVPEAHALLQKATAFTTLATVTKYENLLAQTLRRDRSSTKGKDRANGVL